MLNAVIFDFDGTIVDTEKMHFDAFNAVLAPLGHGFSWKKYCADYIGFDDRDAIKEAFKENGDNISSRNLKRLIEQKAVIFEKLVREGNATPLPGVLELMESIPSDLPIALCTGAFRQDIQPILKQIKLENIFTTIVTAEDTKKGKPHPAPYQLVCKKLGLTDPSTAIAIEDTPPGILSAKGAGLKVLAVTNTKDREYLFEADSITDSLENINLNSLENLVL
jgi:HAD superfamily hydrolase (TIGR01509 family)